MINDRDSRLVSAARERCLRYWYGLKSVGDWPSEGTRVPLRSVELTSPHVFAVTKILAGEDPFPSSNLPADFVHNEDTLVKLCDRYGVEVRESGIKGLPKGSTRGLFATRDFSEGDLVCHVFGRFGYGREYARKTKSRRVWSLGEVGVDEEDGPQLCYLNSSVYAPATYANDCEHGEAKG